MPTLSGQSRRSRMYVLCGLLLTLSGHVWIPSAASGPPELAAAQEALSAERMVETVRTLSHPSLNGRQAGTEHDLRSGQWVAQAFMAAGLQLPLIHNGSMSFPFVGGERGPLGVMASIIPAPVIASDPALRIGTTATMPTRALGTDYLPIFDAPTADIQSRVIFVGYGIVDPSQGLDDYAGVDVTNSIVLFLRGKPDHAQRPVSHADKVRWARERGAIGYLTATGPILHPYEIRRGVTGRPSAFYGQLPPEQAIPGAWVSTDLAVRLLSGSHEDTPDRLRTAQEQLNTKPATQSVVTDYYAALQWNTAVGEGVLANVLGVIPGKTSEAILIGAHRDHFGRPAGLLFPGADDNASGTAVMLEVARALAASGRQPQRTMLFVSFSGEERDLLGSRLYTSRPIVPLGSTTAMINIDHAGVGNGRLTVGVTGLDKSVVRRAGETSGLADQLDVFGFFPGGDHVPFKEAGVPTVTVVSGGVHPHYHQPTDTVETIDPAILHNTAHYVLALAWQLANEP